MLTELYISIYTLHNLVLTLTQSDVHPTESPTIKRPVNMRGLNTGLSVNFTVRTISSHPAVKGMLQSMMDNLRPILSVRYPPNNTATVAPISKLN